MTLNFRLIDLYGNRWTNPADIRNTHGEWLTDVYKREIGYDLDFWTIGKILLSDEDIDCEITKILNGEWKMCLSYEGILLREYIAPNDYVICYYEEQTSKYISKWQMMSWMDHILANQCEIFKKENE